jgi:tRNA A37 methylthiotransferase MiaB
VGFDQSFSFIYSRRPGTPAASLEDDVPAEVKHERLMRLQAQLEENARGIAEYMLGTTQRVLVLNGGRAMLTGGETNLPGRMRKRPEEPG